MGEHDPLAVLGASLDPARVVLPSGTQVTTTVDGESELGRAIPTGAVGRVVRCDAVNVVVDVPGRGSAMYHRDQVSVRRDGELRFAIRRAEAEQALLPCTVLRATVGSRAWGLEEEGSDTDQRGVFLFPFTWGTGLVRPPDTVVSLDGSATHWEAGKAIRQALRADPNTLECLFVPDVQVLDAVGHKLLDAREAFVSRRIYGSFGRYAIAQAKKLRASLRLAQHRTLLLEWLARAPTTLDEVSQRLARETMDESPSSVRRAKQYIKQLYRSLHDQGLVQANSFEAFVEFAREGAAHLELPRELRPKNAYNLLRIVSGAVHWLTTGEPLIRVSGALRDRLLEIKRGEVALEVSLGWTEEVARELEDARDGSPLPPEPDFQRADDLLRSLRVEAARRFIDGRGGPWGRDAPSPPTAEQDHG